MISDGAVRVNGEVVRELGTQADLDQDEIEVEGVGRLQAAPIEWLMLNKPRGVVVTESDPQGRKTAVSLLGRSAKRAKLHAVGRLDMDTEGVLLFTNDGELAQRLLRPGAHVPKRYTTKVFGRPEESDLERLRAGIELDGRRTQPADVHVRRRLASNTWLDVTLTEGRNRQVRRMMEVLGFPVVRLIRIEFAGLDAEGLDTGKSRHLSRREVARLRAWIEPAKG